jgi:ABC-type multidrug transport system fused ATPase/permease subunit
VYTQSEWRRSRQSNYDTSKTPQQKDNEEDVANLIFQDAYVNLLSKVTYWWFGKHILQVGFKRPLQQSDFGSIPKEDSSDTAYKLLKVSWQNELIRAHIDCRPPSINRALARTLWRPTLLAAFFILMANALLFYGPLAVNLIVKYAEDYEDGNLPDYTDTLSFQEFFSNGFVVAVTVFVTTVASTLFMHSHHIVMFRVGVFMQTSIRTLVYEKALRLANWTGEKSELTTGLLLNHMSSDTEAFPHLGFLLNQIWAVPLTVLVVIVLLVINLGWSALIACIVIIALLPVQAKVATALARYQRSNLKLSDDRLKKVNELLQGMKLLKLYAWEESFRKATESVRNSELGILLRVNLLRAIVLFVTAVTPVLVTLVAFGMYTILSDDPLTPAKAFTALALFNMMRAPMILLPFMVNMTVSSLVSLKRLNKFFQARELNQPLRHQSLSSFKLETVHSELPEGIEARISKGSFSWDAEQQDPTLSDISLNFPKGKLTMIVGRVGSGKSSLLSALLGEMTTASGTITWRDKNAPIAYGAQKAWLLNDSLKQNILFGKQLDDKKYREIVDACALKPDIEILPAGDDTEIGEKGINLSGGQKQRVSVARAIYSNASVVLLDDPLSAVDVHVAEQMFEKGIINLLLKQGRTVILATHHLRYLQQADMIVVMEGGHVSHVGTFSKICQENAHLSEVFQRGGSLDDSEEDDEQGEEGNHVAIGPTYEHQASQDSAYSNQKKQDQKSLTSQSKGKRSGQLMSKEERETGSVDLRVYLHYFRSFGVSLLLLVIFSVILNDGLQAGTDFWLSDWSTANISDPNERGTDYYVGGYGILSSLTVLAGFVFSLSFAFASIRASKHLHASMLNRLVLAPMRFFETTPVGRVLNRFSSDTKSMDSILPITIQLFLQTVLRVITAFVVQAIVTPFFLLAGIPIFIVFCIIQYYFRRSQREIQRIVSITRSPIYANFSEMLGGLSTIRAYRRQGDFRKKVRQEINDHANAVVFLQTGNRWLGVRLVRYAVIGS